MVDYEIHDFLFAVTAMYWCHLTKTEIIGSKADLVWDRIIFEGVTKAVYLVSKQHTKEHTWMFKTFYQIV